jgi:hypothetical protein
MKRLLLSALVLAAISSAALAAEPLTEQQMDSVTAGLLIAFASSDEGLALSSININTDQLSALSFAIPGTAIVGHCEADCTFHVNGRSESFTACSACSIEIGKSGITIKDVSGNILGHANL